MTLLPALPPQGEANIAPERGALTKHIVDPSPQSMTKAVQGGRTPPPSSFVSVTRRFT